MLAKDGKGNYVIGETRALAVRLLLATGLRWSDAVRLQTGDLKPDGWLVLTCSKTKKLLRIPLGGADPGLACEVRRRCGRLVPYPSTASASSTGRSNVEAAWGGSPRTG